jgi:integrase/recombinase XerD
MASVKVQLLTWKKSVNDEYPIALVLIKDRKRTIISTGYRSTVKNWDEQRNAPKKSHPLQKELLMIIDQKKLEVNKLLMTLEQEGLQASVGVIRTHLLKEKKRNSTSLFQYFDQTIESLNKSERIGYSNVFKETRRALFNFRQGRDLSIFEITHEFIVKFDTWYLNKGNSLNSIFVFMRTLKTLINNAKKEGLARSDFDPFKDFSFKKYRKHKTEKRAISKQDIKLIFDYKPTPDSSLFHSKNYFMFSYLTRGTNFTDIAFLTWKGISKDNRMKYTRKKTGQTFDMGLLDEAFEIIQYYKDIYYSGNDKDYIFPILNREIHVTPTQIDNRIEKVLKQTNRDLKSIANEIGIDEKITTYVARHSFATILKNEGQGTAVISELLGHESERTTQIYLDSFGNKILDEATKASVWKK